jgi:hypothetical protein
MNKLGESTALASMMLGLCGLVFATAGCDGKDNSDDGAADASETNPATSDTENPGDTEGPGETEDDSDSASDDGDPPPEGLGCGITPTCDKGTYEGNLTLATEADIAVLEGYSHITGYLFIRESDYTCIDFLACLESARGLAVENNEYLRDINGFGNVEEVPFNITISRNPMLESLSPGFDAIRKVSSDGDNVQLGPRGINIYDNDALLDVDTFDELREFEGDLTITNNDSLVAISGFNNVDTIYDHPNPDPDAGTMGKPLRLGGSVTISRNNSLETVDGLSSVIVIYRNLTAQYNPVLTKLTGLHGLMALGGALLITNNPELCTSETCRVGCDLAQGPGEGSSTANNKDC